MTALPNRDVVFVRFQNEGSSHSCLPYFIAIDEHSHSVGEHFYRVHNLMQHSHSDIKEMVLASMHAPAATAATILEHAHLF